MSNESTCCGVGNNSACDTGDTGMMMMATTFVMLQTPAIGLTQAGLIRRKNALSMLMQTMSGFVYGSLLWFIAGFSLTFGETVGGVGVLGNLNNAFFMNVGFDTCFQNSAATSIPGIVFVAFQMMFAVMVPVIVTGAWAERMTFNAFTVFVIFWPILVYYPLAHWVWNSDGWLARLGALDFAGGITIHTSSGIAALVVSSTLSRRLKQGNKESLAHHNIPLTVLGGALIWGGWYSFNGASAFAANGQASLALVNTHISACCGGFIWALITYIEDKHWHLTEILNGAFAGLAAITPGSGYTTPGAAAIVGLLAGVLSWAWVRHAVPKLKIDDALDVMALQGVPGIFGSIAVGFTANMYTGEGQGLISGGNGRLLGIQVLGVAISVAWSGLWTLALMHFIRVTAGINVEPEVEEKGLDLAQIGEQAYDDTLRADLDLGEEALAVKLCDAAGRGDLAEVKSILKMGAEAGMSDYDDRTALHTAAGHGHLHLVQYLVNNKGAEIDAHDRFGNTPLAEAIRHNHQEVVSWLQDHGADSSTLMNSQYFTRHNIFTAAESGNLALLRFYVDDQGADVNVADYDQRTPLHLAATEGNAACVKFLLDHKASPLVTDRWRHLPIGNATRNNFQEIVELLRAAAPEQGKTITSGTDAIELGEVTSETKATEEAQTVYATLLQDELSTKIISAATRLLIDAAARGDISEIKSLLEKGADINGSDYDGRTCLHLAAACNHQEIVRFLVMQRNISVNVFDRFDNTPLSEAMGNGDAGKSVATLLVANGAVAVDPVKGGLLCAHAAAGDLQALKALRMANEALDIADYDGRTALHLASCEGHASVVGWLISQGVKLNTKDRFGNTPADDAARHGQENCVEILRVAGAVATDKSEVGASKQ